MKFWTDPRTIKLPELKYEFARGKCNRCGKWVALIHKTKQFPHGSRLHSHKWSGRTCLGIPTFMVKS